MRMLRYEFMTHVVLHDHNFEQICTKFGMRHTYTLRMVMAGKRAPLTLAGLRSTRRLYTPRKMGGELRQAIRN